MTRFSFQAMAVVFSTIAFSTAFASDLVAKSEANPDAKAESRVATVVCGGRALDGTAIELKFCYKVPARMTYTAARKSCEKQSVVTSFDGHVEEYGSPKRILIAEGLYVGLETLNDGLETHASINFNIEERERPWNTMKVSSVTTGKKYLVTDFVCTITKQP
jgi:hypothetical protein